jgi:prophage regulatory protein
MTSPDDGGGKRLLRARQVYERLGISKAEFYERVKRAEFPKGEKLSPNCVVWRESVVDDWVSATLARNAAE